MIVYQRLMSGLLCAVMFDMGSTAAAAKRPVASQSAKKVTKKATKKVAKTAKAAASSKAANVKSAGVQYMDGVTILSGGAEFSLPPRRHEPSRLVRRTAATLAPRVAATSGLAGLGSGSDYRYNTASIAPITTSPAREVGDKVFPPQFETLATDGQRINLSQYEGKVVLLDFWATWCPPSRDETPALVPLYEKHRLNGFEIIGISLDTSRKKMDAFARDHRMTWRQIYGGKNWESELAQLFEVTAIPETVLLDRDGSVLAVGLRGEVLDAAVEIAMAGRFK